MSETRFKITLTMKSEDLAADELNDEGGDATLVNNSVSFETRHQMEASLIQLLGLWGQGSMEKKSGES